MSRESVKNNKKKTPIKTKVGAKFLSTVYGHPIRDMKLIVITGTTGKVTVAHFVHEILKEANQHVAILASEDEIKLGTLHRFLSKAWKTNANFVVVTAPATSLKKNIFYELPVHVAALTDYIPSTLDSVPAEDYEAATDTLFDMNPNLVVLNRDDASYDSFTNFKGIQGTITYGRDHYSDVRIENSALYKMGCEALLSILGNHTTVASFMNGEPTVSYMACAAAIACALHINEKAITAGISNYDPENITGGEETEQ